MIIFAGWVLSILSQRWSAGKQRRQRSIFRFFGRTVNYTWKLVRTYISVFTFLLVSKFTIFLIYFLSLQLFLLLFAFHSPSFTKLGFKFWFIHTHFFYYISNVPSHIYCLFVNPQWYIWNWRIRKKIVHYFLICNFDFWLCYLLKKKQILFLSSVFV